MPNDDQWQDVPTAGTGGDEWQDVPAAPKPPSKARPGMLTRFKHGLRSSMGMDPEGTLSSDISDLGTGFKQLATHPYESGKTLLEGMNESQQQVIDKAYGEQQSPDLWTKAKGYVRGAESAIPGVGPILSRAGDLAGEGDYAGMAGTMLPLASGRPMEEGVRVGRSGLAGAVRAAPEAGGALAGYAAGGEHPYMGAYIGRELGRRFSKPAGRLADAIEPTPRSTGFGTKIGGSWVPEGGGASPRLASAMDEDAVTHIPIPRREFPGETPNYMASVPRTELERLAKTGKPGAGTQIQQLGGKVLYVPEEGYAPPRSRTTYGGRQEPSEAAPASPVSKSSGTRASSPASGAEKRGVPRPKGTTISDKMSKQFALEESVKDTTKRLKAEKDPTVKRHMQQQIDDFNKELKGLQ